MASTPNASQALTVIVRTASAVAATVVPVDEQLKGTVGLRAGIVGHHWVAQECVKTNCGRTGSSREVVVALASRHRTAEPHVEPSEVHDEVAARSAAIGWKAGANGLPQWRAEQPDNCGVVLNPSEC